MATAAVRAKKAPAIQPLARRKAWGALKAHYKKIQPVHLRSMFEDDAKRGEKLKVDALGIYLDYSKNRINDTTIKLLVDLAKESGLQQRIDALGGVARRRATAARRAGRADELGTGA